MCWLRLHDEPVSAQQQCLTAAAARPIGLPLGRSALALSEPCLVSGSQVIETRTFAWIKAVLMNQPVGPLQRTASASSLQPCA